MFYGRLFFPQFKTIEEAEAAMKQKTVSLPELFTEYGFNEYVFAGKNTIYQDFYMKMMTF